MDIQVKLASEIKRLDRRVGQSLHDLNYDQRAADRRELLEQALGHIRQQDVHIALLQSVSREEWPKSRRSRP